CTTECACRGGCARMQALPCTCIMALCGRWVLRGYSLLGHDCLSVQVVGKLVQAGLLKRTCSPLRVLAGLLGTFAAQLCFRFRICRHRPALPSMKEVRPS